MMRKRLTYGGLGLSLAAGLAVSAALWADRGDVKKDDGGAAPKNAASKITHVTVYQTNALVTREVDVPEGAGIMELVVSSLPPQTVNTSLYSEGTDGLRVLNTRFRMRNVREDTREEVRKLEAQMKDLQKQERKIKAELATVQQNMAMLTNLEKFTSVSASSATEKGKLDGDQIIVLADYVVKQRGVYATQMNDLDEQLKTNVEEAEFARRQWNELTAGSARVERDAVIVIEKQGNAAGKVRLNYLVDSASWRPQYRFRAGKKASDSVQLEYLAGVIQQTGEEWRGVNLTLSTAQPLLNAAPPELGILQASLVPRGGMPPGQPIPPQFGGDPGGRFGVQRDNREKAQTLRGQAGQEYSQKKEAQGGKLVNDAAALEQANEILWADRDDLLARRNKGGLGVREGQSVTYHLPNKLTVPSRTEEQVIEVARLDMNPDYFYKAVPVLSAHVYRLATLNNKTEYVLLPGEATMYIGTDFVGRMDLPLVAVGEEFVAGFGVDPQLQVKREMMDTSRTMQGGNQVLKYDYRILVSSYKSEPVKIQLWDRLPKAEQETVGVTVLKTTPELCADPLYVREHKSNNLLRWDLELKPGMSGERALAVSYEFKMELDKQMTIGGFQSK